MTTTVRELELAAAAAADLRYLAEEASGKAAMDAYHAEVAAGRWYATAEDSERFVRAAADAAAAYAAFAAAADLYVAAIEALLRGRP